MDQPKERGRPEELTSLQKTALITLAGISGYSLPRIERLLIPFVDDVTIKVLHKRVVRLGLRGGDVVPSKVEAGTFVVHGIRARYGQKCGTLLLVMELRTGWLHGVLLPTVTAKDIVENICRMADKLMKVDKTQLPVLKILLATAVETNRARELRNEPPVTAATVNRKPLAALITDIKKELGKTKHDKADVAPQLIHTGHSQLPEVLKSPLQPSEKQPAKKNSYEKKQLNNAIEEFLTRYNQAARTPFRRAEESVNREDFTITPADRLVTALQKEWAKHPEWKQKKPVYPGANISPGE